MCYIDVVVSSSFQETVECDEWDSDKESLPDDRDGPQGRGVFQISLEGLSQSLAFVA